MTKEYYQKRENIEEKINTYKAEKEKLLDKLNSSYEQYQSTLLKRYNSLKEQLSQKEEKLIKTKKINDYFNKLDIDPTDNDFKEKLQEIKDENNRILASNKGFNREDIEADLKKVKEQLVVKNEIINDYQTLMKNIEIESTNLLDKKYKTIDSLIKNSNIEINKLTDIQETLKKLII